MLNVKNQARKGVAARVLKYKAVTDPGAVPLVGTKFTSIPSDYSGKLA